MTRWLGSFGTAVATVALLLVSGSARAGIADTAPQGVVLIDMSYINTATQGRYDSSGDLVDLNDPVERFAPTGEFQGKILVPGQHEAKVLLTRVAIGITDWLSFAAVFPYALSQETRLNLGWESGDFIPEFNREMSEDDFWEWAGGLGQPRPEDWKDTNRPGDLILAGLVNLVRKDWTQVSFLMFGNTFTGEPAAPEQLGSVGTSGFDFITNGDLGLHLLSDWRLPERDWLSQFTLSAEVFYEFFFEREFKASSGFIHPLILNRSPFVGDTYKVDRGDVYGGTIGLSYDLLPGTTDPSWLTENNPGLQARLPPLFAVSVFYQHFHSGATDYTSDAQIWDYEQEADNRELYKNILKFQGRASFIRYGVPLDVFGGYVAQSWLPGKNFRPADGFEVGIRLYYSVFINPIDLIFGE